MNNMRFTSAIRVATLVCAFAAPAASFADTPDAYLDYVESTGSQYIDTGVNGADGLLVEAEMEWTSVPASSWACFLGAAASDSVMYCPYQIYDAATHRMTYKNQNPAVQGSSKPVSGVRYHVVVSMDDGAQTNTIRRIDGASMARVYTKSGTLVSDWRELFGPVATQCPMYVFARNFAGNADRFASARLYSLKIWRRGNEGEYELARHFLPCRKNNRAALYDKENETIHFPEGGELVAGSVLPRPRDFVEWVQSDGADGDRQLYVDTGVPAKAGIGMVVDMEWATKPAGYAVENIFCGATSTDSKRFWLYDAVADADKATATHRMGYDNWKLQIQTGSSIYAGTRYRVETFLAKSEQSITVCTSAQNGTWVALSTRPYNDADVIDTQQSLFAFANNNAGTAEPVSAKARLFSLVLRNELGVVRDFRPCVADNDKAGLYDIVSDRWRDCGIQSLHRGRRGHEPPRHGEVAADSPGMDRGQRNKRLCQSRHHRPRRHPHGRGGGVERASLRRHLLRRGDELQLCAVLELPRHAGLPPHGLLQRLLDPRRRQLRAGCRPPLSRGNFAQERGADHFRNQV